MSSIVRTIHLLSASGPIVFGLLLTSCASPPRAQSVTALVQTRPATVKPELGKEYPAP